MSSVQVVMNNAAVRAFLKSGEVQALVKDPADRIAAAAGEGMEARVSVGQTRARAVVITATEEAIVEEAVHRTLTRAIDAGRG